jgi:hypothetical protein
MVSKRLIDKIKGKSCGKGSSSKNTGPGLLDKNKEWWKDDFSPEAVAEKKENQG